MRARELGRTPIVVGDRVGLVGDLRGQAGHARPHRPGRGADDGAAPHRRRHRPGRAAGGGQRRAARDRHGGGRPGAAHRVRRPLPGRGLRGRPRPAAVPDQGRPRPIPGRSPRTYAELELPVRGHPPRPAARLGALADALDGRVSALVGHSGVGKSTLVNALRPGRRPGGGAVSARSARAATRPWRRSRCRCPTAAAWVVDTPGVRSFGLAHVTPDDVLAAFDDLAAAIEDCPRGCGHLGPPADPECALDVLVARGQAARRPARRAAPGARRVALDLSPRPDSPTPFGRNGSPGSRGTPPGWLTDRWSAGILPPPESRRPRAEGARHAPADRGALHAVERARDRRARPRASGPDRRGASGSPSG